MAMIKPESKLLEDVRRWRKEAHEEQLAQSFEERTAEESRLAVTLGLRVMDERDLVMPEGVPPTKSAG